MADSLICFLEGCQLMAEVFYLAVNYPLPTGIVLVWWILISLGTTKGHRWLFRTFKLATDREDNDESIRRF
jgi:hypothetical protein